MKLESTRTLKAGAGLVQQFTVSGVPTPSVTWTLDGQPLDATAVSSTAELTSLSVKKCSVKNAGQYEVTATNEVGTDTVRFMVVVNGLYSAHLIHNFFSSISLLFNCCCLLIYLISYVSSNSLSALKR